MEIKIFTTQEVFQDTLAGQGGPAASLWCDCTGSYMANCIAGALDHHFLLFRSYPTLLDQSCPPMGDFENWSRGHWITEASSIALATLAVPHVAMAGINGDGRKGSGYMGTTADVSFSALAKRISCEYLSLQSLAASLFAACLFIHQWCWGDRWRYQSAETLWTAATSILYWNLIAPRSPSLDNREVHCAALAVTKRIWWMQWIAVEFMYLMEVSLIQNFES